MPIILMISIVFCCGFCAEETESFMQGVRRSACQSFEAINALWQGVEDEIRLDKVADDFVIFMAGVDGLSLEVLHGKSVSPVAETLGERFVKSVQENNSISEKAQNIIALNRKKKALLYSDFKDKAFTAQQFLETLRIFHNERKMRIAGVEALHLDVCWFLQKVKGNPDEFGEPKSLYCVQSVLQEMTACEAFDGPLYQYAVMKLLNEGFTLPFKSSPEEHVSALMLLSHFYKRMQSLESEMYCALKVLALKKRANDEFKKGYIFIPEDLFGEAGGRFLCEDVDLNPYEACFIQDKQVQNILDKICYIDAVADVQSKHFSVTEDFVRVVPELIAEESARRVSAKKLFSRVRNEVVPRFPHSDSQVSRSCARLYCCWTYSRQR